MRNKLVFLSILLLSFTYVFGSNTVLKGTAKLFGGKELSVIKTVDYLNNSNEKIGFVTIKSNGSFEYSFDIDVISEVTLKIEDKTVRLFVKPGNVYNLNLSYSKEENKKRIHDKRLSLKFNFPAPTEINHQISKFNKSYDQFVEDNYEIFVKRDRTIIPKIKEFKEQTSKTSSSYTKFAKNYIT